MSTDGDLVARIRRGDADGYGELYERYKGPIFRTALAMTRDRGLAEEVLQDCFLRAFAAIDRAQEDVSLGPWLQRIAMNLALNVLGRKRLSLVPIEMIGDGLPSAERTSPESVAANGELRQVVRAAIGELSPDHRAVVVLYYLHGYGLAEVAGILDCPVGTVKSRLHYATRWLRQRLLPYCRHEWEFAYEPAK
ncbi:MAG: RNA polymerase sigma factor [Chloroflexi bacterium]|nr:RNA polymerase sigma factor [Chloroflexota bacterium]